jgi:hypothetical protein
MLFSYKIHGLEKVNIERSAGRELEGRSQSVRESDWTRDRARQPSA